MYTISWKELQQILLMRVFSRENMALQLLAGMRKDLANKEEFYNDTHLQTVGCVADVKSLGMRGRETALNNRRAVIGARACAGCHKCDVVAVPYRRWS